MTNKLRVSDINAAGSEIESAMDTLTYMPSNAQRESKAAFWEAWRDDPGVGKDDLTPAAVIQETGDKRINVWWKIPLFRDWFLNDESFIHKTIANGEKGIGILTDIMDDPETSPSLKMKAAIASIEALNKYRSRTAAEKFADKALNEASPEDLDRMIDNFEKKG